MAGHRAPLNTAEAISAAKAAAARKAERAPRRLTEAEVGLLPGPQVLELGNAGKLRHLGVGLKPVKPAAPVVDTPKGSAAQRGTSKTGRTASKTTRARTGRPKKLLRPDAGHQRSRNGSNTQQQEQLCPSDSQAASGHPGSPACPAALSPR